MNNHQFNVQMAVKGHSHIKDILCIGRSSEDGQDSDIEHLFKEVLIQFGTWDFYGGPEVQ